MHQGKPDGPMMLTSATLGAAEWAHFAPPVPKSAAPAWTVPKSVAEKLAAALLAPGDSGGMLRPQDFREAALKARIESIESATARILLSGKWQAEGLYGGEKEFPFTCSARAEGIAIYDVEEKSMRSLLLVLSGRMWTGRSSAGTEKTGRETGGVIEWTLQPSAEKKDLPRGNLERE
jgi:hypothetical protein